MKAILYPHDGHLAVTSGVADYAAEQTALLLTPEGVPYLIVDASEVPADQMYFNAWTSDFSQPDGVGVSRAEYERLYPPSPVVIPPASTFVTEGE
jgi:hypothetical protein